MLGGFAADVVGFAWTAAFFGLIIFVQAAVVTGLFVFGRFTLDEKPSASAVGRMNYRPLDESHDTVRGYRGGLAAPSADLTHTLARYTSDGSV